MSGPMQNPNDIKVNGQRYPAASLRLLKLHADFTCANCGFCCNDGWDIILSPGECDRVRGVLRAHGWTEEAVNEIVTAVRQPGGTECLAPKRSESGGCIFHETGEWGTRCFIHHLAGSEVLPAVCQSFPRMAIATPTGVRLTLSCACPTAARTLLREGGLDETRPASVCAGRPELLGWVIAKDRLAPQLAAGCHPEWGAFDYFWRWTAEWMSAPAMTTAQALWGLGRVMEVLEENGAVVRVYEMMVEALETVQSALQRQTLRDAASLEPLTELGAIYFDTLLQCVRQVKSIPAPWERAWKMLHGEGGAGRGALVEAYDRLIRPELGKYATIERNFVSARLYANPHAYRAGRMRTGYFLAIMNLIALRFSALMICLEEGTALDETTWLRAAGMTDYLLLHNNATEDGFIQLIEPMLDCPIQDLARAALF